MPAKVLNLTIEQGSTFKWTITIYDPDVPTDPFDLTNCTVASDARVDYTDALAAFSFAIDVDADPTTGKVMLSLTDEVTAGIEAGNYLYDVEVENAIGEVYKIYKGKITITPEVTK